MLHNLGINWYCPHWDFVITLQGQIAQLQGGESADLPFKEWPRPPKSMSQALSTPLWLSQGLKHNYKSSICHLEHGFMILEDFTPWVFQSCTVVNSCILGENTNTINSYGSCMNLMKPSIWAEGAQLGLLTIYFLYFSPFRKGVKNQFQFCNRLVRPKLRKLYNSNLD